MYIPTHWLKDVSDVGGSVLARVWKEEILLSKYFPNKLKLADVKKNDKKFCWVLQASKRLTNSF